MPRQMVPVIEERFNAPINVVLAELVEQGRTKQSAATLLGVSKATLIKWTRKYHVAWPAYTREHADARQRRNRESSQYLVTHNGEEKPLAEAARDEGLSYQVVLDRYKKGHRGNKLFRPVRRYTKPPKLFDLELTEREWGQVCELASAIGVKRASQKLEIPMSAVSLAMKGELERLG